MNTPHFQPLHMAVQTLYEPDIWRKLQLIEEDCHQALTRSEKQKLPKTPARDIHVCALSQLPPKPGFSTIEGQARLLHDLASIELQAMELGLRTLVEYQEQSSKEFKEQLVNIILDEAKHLKMCLTQIQSLGFRWGDWPSHLGLWACVSEQDSFSERLILVHRYLEGSGLDAGEKILRRLSGSVRKGTLEVVKTISEEELGHVRFGSDWFKSVCQNANLDTDQEFKRILTELYPRLPRRLERLNYEIRKQVGFSDEEIKMLEQIQSWQKNAKTNS